MSDSVFFVSLSLIWPSVSLASGGGVTTTFGLLDPNPIGVSPSNAVLAHSEQGSVDLGHALCVRLYAVLSFSCWIVVHLLQAVVQLLELALKQGSGPISLFHVRSEEH